MLNHPGYVIDKVASDPMVKKFISERGSAEAVMNDPTLSGKLKGLVTLLEDCDIIKTNDEQPELKKSAYSIENSANLMKDMANRIVAE